MNEIERAIEHIADNVRFLKTHPYVDDSLRAHELALEALKEKLTRQENAPLTWNERINQMTAEEKAECFSRITTLCPPNGDVRKTQCTVGGCEECWSEFLNSPYTEGEKV